MLGITCNNTAVVSFSEQLNLKNKIILLFVQNYQKKKELPDMNFSRDKDQKDAFIGNKMQLQNHSLTFIRKNKSLSSATSIHLVHSCLTTLLLPWTS